MLRRRWAASLSGLGYPSIQVLRGETLLGLISEGRQPGGVTLPSECVSLNRLGFGDRIHPRGRRGGGNVGIGFIDFQGLWEGRKTALSFSGLSINRHCVPCMFESLRVQVPY